MKFIKDNFLWGGATAASQVEGAYNEGGKTLTMLEMTLLSLLRIELLFILKKIQKRIT